MITLNDIREGSVVVVRPGFGMDPPVTVTVGMVDPDIKNGRAGIEYNFSWAYLDQIDRVVKY